MRGSSRYIRVPCALPSQLAHPCIDSLRPSQNDQLHARGLNFHLYRWPGSQPAAVGAAAWLGRYRRDVPVPGRLLRRRSHLSCYRHARLRSHPTARRGLSGFQTTSPTSMRCWISWCRTRRSIWSAQQHGWQHRDAVRRRTAAARTSTRQPRRFRDAAHYARAGARSLCANGSMK